MIYLIFGLVSFSKINLRFIHVVKCINYSFLLIA